MRLVTKFFLAAAALGSIGFSCAPASAKTVSECNAEYAANKTAIQAAKEKKADFVKACRAGAETIPAAATSGAAPAKTPAASVAPAATAAPAATKRPRSVKTASQCDAEYAANKAAIQAAKEKKADFVKACRAGTETIPTAATSGSAPTATPAAVAAPAPAAAPAASERPPARRPAVVKSAAPAAAAPVSASETQAQAKCPGALVVWVNTDSKIYHFKGARSYGTTKAGTYICEAEAIKAGDRAAKNEKHP